MNSGQTNDQAHFLQKRGETDDGQDAGPMVVMDMIEEDWESNMKGRIIFSLSSSEALESLFIPLFEIKGE